MKSTTYRLVMSDGQKIQVPARSATEAIGGALMKYRGQTVLHCYSGMTERDCEIARQMDRECWAMPGIITHEVPHHEAMPRVIDIRTAGLSVANAELFPEDLILSESARALGRKRDDPL